MFKIENPNWKSATKTKADLNAPKVAAYLAANSGNKLVSIAELKAGIPEASADLTRPVVNEICAILGLNLQGAEDELI